MLIDFIIFLGVFLLGFITGSYFMYSRWTLMKDVSGSILMVKQDEEEAYDLLLSINKGHTEDIKPGNVIRLAVETATMTKE